jgi:hypothetical protein
VLLMLCPCKAHSVIVRFDSGVWRHDGKDFASLTVSPSVQQLPAGSCSGSHFSIINGQVVP